MLLWRGGVKGERVRAFYPSPHRKTPRTSRNRHLGVPGLRTKISSAICESNSYPHHRQEDSVGLWLFPVQLVLRLSPHHSSTQPALGWLYFVYFPACWKPIKNCIWLVCAFNQILDSKEEFHLNLQLGEKMCTSSYPSRDNLLIVSYFVHQLYLYYNKSDCSTQSQIQYVHALHKHQTKSLLVLAIQKKNSQVSVTQLWKFLMKNVKV